MKKLLLLSIATLFVIAVYVSEVNAWRREYRSRQRGNYQSYTIKNPDRLKGCQAICQKEYGVDGAKCKTMEIDAKKACRQNSRSCNAKCWNKYR